MIVIRIELHSAITGKVTEIGSAIIVNKGDRSGLRHNYKFMIARKNRSIMDVLRGESKPTRSCDIENWPRASKTVWQLLQRCLNEAYQAKGK